MVLIYNVPHGLISAFPNEHLVLRSADPLALVDVLRKDDAGRIKAVQLLSLGQGAETLGTLPVSVAIDLCVTDVHEDSKLLPHCSEVLRDRPVRVVVPVQTGFGQPVKTALIAGLRVRLEIDQPEDLLVEELIDTLVFFARDPRVSQPVDLFHGLFQAFLTKQTESLWRIQEEHPSFNRYVTDTGELTLSKRLAAVKEDLEPTNLLSDHKRKLFVRKAECCTCRFFTYCEGYFKLPSPDYACSAIQRFFQTLWDYSEELRSDLSRYPDSTGSAH